MSYKSEKMQKVLRIATLPSKSISLLVDKEWDISHDTSALFFFFLKWDTNHDKIKDLSNPKYGTYRKSKACNVFCYHFWAFFGHEFISCLPYFGSFPLIVQFFHLNGVSKSRNTWSQQIEYIYTPCVKMIKNLIDHFEEVSCQVINMMFI